MRIQANAVPMKDKPRSPRFRSSACLDVNPACYNQRRLQVTLPQHTLCKEVGRVIGERRPGQDLSRKCHADYLCPPEIHTLEAVLTLFNDRPFNVS
jgi:hypothetical protein